VSKHQLISNRHANTGEHTLSHRYTNIHL